MCSASGRVAGREKQDDQNSGKKTHVECSSCGHLLDRRSSKEKSAADALGARSVNVTLPPAGTLVARSSLWLVVNFIPRFQLVRKLIELGRLQTVKR